MNNQGLLDTDRPKILAVDDKPENLLVLEKLLTPLNVFIAKATNGNDALALTLEHDFMLILLDVQMPGMDGYEVLELLSYNEQTKYIPVIFITANYADEKHELKGYAYGAVDYLFKPINEQILLGKVKVFLELYEQRLQYKQLHQRYELILNAAGEGVFGLDINGKINFINPAAAKLLGRRSDDLLGKPFSLMLPPNKENTEPFHWKSSDIYQSCKAGQTVTKGDEIFIRADKSELPVEYTASPLQNEQGQYIGNVIVFSDITLRKTVEEQLKHLALYDHLTELPNRLLFEKSIHQVMARAARHHRSMAIMLLDLDHFKQVNDTLGHDVGDLLLKQVAKRLKDCVRQSDVVARLGGDEFAVILDEIENPEDAAVVAEKIIESLKSPFSINSHDVNSSTSIGIAVYPLSGTDLTTLTKNADVAMYRAKHAGRSNYRFFTAGMNEQNVHRLNLAHNLRHAIERDEFYLCFQPKLDLISDRVTGIEALIRWNHPNLGNIYPSEFIPISEEIGIMPNIGSWVINKVCETLQEWQKKKLNFPRIAINLSSSQLNQGNMETTIAEAIAGYAIDPSKIELEITETAIMLNHKQSSQTLNALHNLGIYLSIDDFGTGYSSLSYLKTLPVDALKIDQSFVQDITNDPNDAAIVKAIIALAHNMGLLVIAEGVEDNDQLHFLKQNACDQIQGYLFSKPLTKKELHEFFKERPDYLKNN